MESPATIEERLARVEGQLTALGGRSRSHRRSASGGPRADQLTRAGFLRKASAVAAGVAGAALLETRGAKDAYATTTDTNFVATGIIGGGGNGFAAPASGNFAVGVQAFGGSSSGFGIQGFGGPPAGPGVEGHGGTSGGAGVVGHGHGGGAALLGFADSGAGVDGESTTGVGGSFTGGRAPVQLALATMAGPPTSGLHGAGDIWADSMGTLWICKVAGTPGGFVPLQPGGLGNALYTAVSTLQYTLANSDGLTWMDIDTTSPTPLFLSVTPAFKCQAVISGNADLWTANAGYNQDLGIAITGPGYPTTAGQPEGWKESGGFAGTFSPNAAFVETVVPLAAGATYTIRLQWKTNKPAGGATIYAGAGPIGGKFSQIRLRVLLITTA